jgi:hypothetical protein
MQESIQAGAILIKEGTLMPGTLRFETEGCVPGWRLVKHLDAYGLDRKIRAAGWTFVCQAGETQTTVFGIDKENMVRRAIGRILAQLKSDAFNSLAIVRVASESSKRFLGVGYLTVFAQSRHIQKSGILRDSWNVPRLGTGRSEPSSPSTGMVSREKELSEEPAKQARLAIISSQ